MVRPDRVELPTFWFVGMQSDRILLILMPATTHFQANTWRTTAGIDERLMKGLSRDRLLQTNFSSDSFLHASGAGGAVARKTTPSGVPTHDRHGTTNPTQSLVDLLLRRQ